MICKLKTSEFLSAVEVIQNSFSTVAEEMGITKENCPRYIGFTVSGERLQAQYDMGWEMFGLYNEDRLIGYVSLSNEGNGVYEIHNLSVLNDMRHKGYGRQLLDFCIEKVDQLGGEKIILSIIEDNTRLKEWYQGYGFIHTGTKKYDHLIFTSGYLEIKV